MSRLTVARATALTSLTLAFGALGVVVVGASQPSGESAADDLAGATARAWPALGDLSRQLEALRPEASRQAATGAARRADAALEDAIGRVGRLDLPVSATMSLLATERALRDARTWVEGVGSVLANPRSHRRAGLAEDASAAALAVKRLANRVDAAERTVRGTGKLLSATK